MCFFRRKKKDKKAKKETTSEVKTKNQKKEEPSKPSNAPSTGGTKIYHVNKRRADHKWTVKYATGSKVIKLFDSKEEAVDFANKLAENSDGIVLLHSAKGKNRGKITGKAK